MRKMKRAKRWTGLLFVGLIGAGACFSGAAVTGVAAEVTAYAAGDVAVNATNFPDENFRKYVSENIDKDKNENLSEKEIDGCKEITCWSSNISNLKGIEKFTGLECLYCQSNNLSSLDVSKNTALKELSCANNNLSSLDVSKNTELTRLHCEVNKLISLNVNGPTDLTYLYCYSNNLSSLDVSKNTALTNLGCDNNNLSSLDVSKNTNLRYVDVGDQKKDVTAPNGEILLSALSPVITASNITNLKGATLSGNKLTNITGNTITYDYKTGYNDETMDVTLNVKKEAVPEKVTLDKKLIVLDKGKTGKLTATVTPTEAKDKTVTWSSSNTNVATVGTSGNVKAINHGTAKITAKTSNGKTAECEVRVNFIDVTNPKDWYYKAVYWAAEKGITTGTDGKFFHADNCTREQAITFLWRMAGKPNPKSMTSKFSDVKDSKRYSYKAIMWGSENGIITGTNGKFYPTDTCTREQIVTMLWRQAGQPAPKNMTSKFKDVTDSKRYSYKAIMWAQENGITTGTNGLFSPTGLCKRREIVTFIYRYKN